MWSGNFLGVEDDFFGHAFGGYLGDVDQFPAPWALRLATCLFIGSLQRLVAVGAVELDAHNMFLKRTEKFFGGRERTV